MAQDFIRRLLEVDLTSSMSLTDALRRPWPDSSDEGFGGGRITTVCTTTIHLRPQRDHLPRDVLRAQIRR